MLEIYACDDCGWCYTEAGRACIDIDDAGGSFREVVAVAAEFSERLR